MLRLIGEGSIDAFNDLYARTYVKMLRTCQAICPNPTVADDILQDAYIAVWRNADRYDMVRGSPISWMVAIARNRSIDWIRKTRYHVHLPLDCAKEIVDSAPSAESKCFEFDELRYLDACLAKLGGKDERLIRNALLSGLSYAQLAARDDVPLGTMKSSIRRGLGKLQLVMALAASEQRENKPR